MSRYAAILPTARELMRFRVIDPADESDVLGGAVGADNFFLTVALVELLDYRGYPAEGAITDLPVGGTCKGEFRMSGRSGVYTILRVV